MDICSICQTSFSYCNFPIHFIDLHFSQERQKCDRCRDALADVYSSYNILLTFSVHIQVYKKSENGLKLAETTDYETTEMM